MNNFYCPLPFRHVFLEPRGIKPCCSYTDLYTGTVEEWLSSDHLEQLQQQVMQGQVPPGCASCVAGESRDGTSTRLGALRDYSNILATDTHIDYIDYRSSNVCNFRCRSCDPYYSHGIAQEAERNSELEEFYSIPPKKLAPTNEEDKQWIIDHLDQISRLMFTGGEPTRIREVREIIEIIQQKNYEHIDIQMITNGSFTDPYWFEFTQQYSRVNWTISLDAVGTPAEIIRDGTDWNLVKSNVEKLFDLSPSVNVGTVVTNLNLFQLGDLFDFVNQLHERYSHRNNGRTQHIEICNWPQHLSPYNWPNEKKIEILRYLHSINKDNLQPKQKQIISTLLHQIPETPFNEELWNKSTTYNKILDSTRSQDHTHLLTAYKYPAKEEKPCV